MVGRGACDVVYQPEHGSLVTAGCNGAGQAVRQLVIRIALRPRTKVETQTAAVTSGAQQDGKCGQLTTEEG